MSHPIPPARRCRAVLQITDEAGATNRYSLKPYAPPGALKGFRVTKTGGDLAVYQVTLGPRGAVSCSCPGFTFSKNHAPCKHLSALAALGILDAEECLRLEELRLTNEATAERLQAEARELAEVRHHLLKGRQPPRHRKSKVPVAKPTPVEAIPF